ncbi:MAG: glycosyltransferase family 2 protein [Muribaculaceae bacterium]
MGKISAVVNTYNAEKYLDKVLQSLQGFDEIVVCDMESTDNTLAIADNYGCKIVRFPKDKYTFVEPARNFAIQSASNDWILVVDADEIIPQELREYLYNLIVEPTQLGGLYIPRKNFFMGRFMPCYYPDYILRFLRKEGALWEEKVHSIPTVNGKIERIPKERKELAIIHLANDSYYESIRKMNEYTENERLKRAPKYHFGQMLYAPLFRFFKTYILKGGFRAGRAGFIHAVFDAQYHFNALAKIEETRQISRANKDIDKYL